MYFERKNYYYPDMPKNYQITQNPPEDCVGMNGYIDVEREDGTTFKVGIDNIHLEEDAASLDHYFDTSCIDYNRAGVPLLELVTNPDMHSADEAVLFLEQMRSIYQYANISDADTKKGQIRCDVNVSIMDADLDETNPDNWGTKIEIKNVNSFGGVKDAINYEIKRQTKLKETGEYENMEQQTRRWDEESGTTIYMRSKVDAIDYKYFVDPNLPKFKIDPAWLEEIRASIPALANERKQKYKSVYGLSHYDASVIIKEREYAEYFEKCIELGIEPKTACNWLTTQILGEINKKEIPLQNFYITPEHLKQIIVELEKGTISSKQAKEIFNKALTEQKEPKTFINQDMAQISDKTELENLISKIILENPQQVEEYKNGKDNLFDYFVGQVMKNTRGKANPVITKDILKEKLGK